MNSAVGRQQGISDEQLVNLAGFASSSEFSGQEKAVLCYAEGMTGTPAAVTDEIFAEMRKYFTTAQIVEITGAVALENFRSRFNRALKIETDDFCELPADHPVRRAISRAPSS